MTAPVRTATESNATVVGGELVERPAPPTVVTGPQPQVLPSLGSDGDRFVNASGAPALARERFIWSLHQALPEARWAEIIGYQRQARAAGLEMPAPLTEGEQRAVRGAVQEFLLGMPRKDLMAQARGSLRRWTQFFVEPARPPDPQAAQVAQTPGPGHEDIVSLAFSPTGQRMRIAGGKVEAFTAQSASVTRGGIAPVFKGGLTLRPNSDAAVVLGAEHRDGRLAAQLGAWTPVPLGTTHFRIAMDLQAASGTASLTHDFGPHAGELYATRGGGSLQTGARLVMNLGPGNRRGASFAFESSHRPGAPSNTGISATYVLMF